MDLSRLFIRNLKKWRRLTGLSQKELAEKCGATHSYIRQIESGIGHPSFAMLAKIAEALEVEPYQLFFDESANSGNLVREKHMDSVRDKLIQAVAGDILSAFEEMKHSL